MTGKKIPEEQKMCKDGLVCALFEPGKGMKELMLQLLCTVLYGSSPTQISTACPTRPSDEGERGKELKKQERQRKTEKEGGSAQWKQTTDMWIVI